MAWSANCGKVNSTNPAHSPVESPNQREPAKHVRSESAMAPRAEGRRRDTSLMPPSIAEEMEPAQ